MASIGYDNDDDDILATNVEVEEEISQQIAEIEHLLKLLHLAPTNSLIVELMKHKVTQQDLVILEKQEHLVLEKVKIIRISIKN